MEVKAKVLVDWGTSQFRALLISNKGNLLDSIETNDGAARMHRRVQEGSSYEIFLEETLHRWLEDCSLPVILVGMLGSSIGWVPVPAVRCPASIDDTLGHLHKVNFKCPAAIVPGMAAINRSKTADFMRGEESQIFGWWVGEGKPMAEYSLCLPGTHTKWVDFAAGHIKSFSTALTGELYALLSKHSILASSEQQHNRDEFMNGVYQAVNYPGVIHQLFSCRSKVLEGELSGDDHHSYMSGLLIGDEVSTLAAADGKFFKRPVFIIGNPFLSELYQLVISQFGTQVETSKATDCLVHFASEVNINN